LAGIESSNRPCGLLLHERRDRTTRSEDRFEASWLRGNQDEGPRRYEIDTLRLRRIESSA